LFACSVTQSKSAALSTALVNWNVLLAVFVQSDPVTDEGAHLNNRYHRQWS